MFTSLVALAATAFIGCDTTSNTNVSVNGNKVANNTAVVTNTNTNTIANANTASNKELTRDDFDKDKAKYEKEAKDAKSTIGQGANDLWIWTKTRAALTTADDLRDSTINVDVSNDVVTLKGTVGTAAQKATAEKTAQSIEGVKSVKNELKVDAKDSAVNQASTSLTDSTNSSSNAKSNANTKK